MTDWNNIQPSITLQRMIAMSWLMVEESFAVLGLANKPTDNRVRSSKHQ